MCVVGALDPEMLRVEGVLSFGLIASEAVRA